MTHTLRVLVVDDEKPARERLRNVLKRDARIELVSCCASGIEALETLDQARHAHRPVHVLFLDVQMPELDGFAVVSRLATQCDSESMPVIVFVTAYDEYALRAFEAHAVDYLLKPFSDERFQATLDRALRHARADLAHAVMSRLQGVLDGLPPLGAATAQEAQAASPRQPALDKIVVKGPHRVRLLPVEQISWIEADGVYVKLHTRDGEVHLHRGLLGSLDASLDERRFVRIHRSAIVNIDLVDELSQDPHGDYLVVLRDGTRIRVGRRFRARLQARLGQQL
jgi:two-component system, LytTR family, response regulator